MASLRHQPLRRHDHGGGDDDSMTMGTLTLSPYAFPPIFWSVVGAVLAVLTAVHWLNVLVCRQRIHHHHHHHHRNACPSRPRHPLARLYATLTAAAREACHAALPVPWLPPLGSLALVLAYLALILVLCFYHAVVVETSDNEQVAYRAGFISLAQVPLVFLLAGKHNLVGYLTGVSHERLNVYHRNAARVLWVSVTVHFAHWLYAWAPYGSYTTTQLTSYATATRGFAAWILLSWTLVSSLLPLRRLSYEFFVLQHLLSYAAFTTLIFLHVPAATWVYLWPAVAFYLFDRLARLLQAAWLSFRPGRQPLRALLQSESEDLVSLSITNPSFSWSPGQHVLITLPSLDPLSSHPFTIATLPSDNTLLLAIRRRNGFTKRLHKAASSSSPQTHAVILQGPFGAHRPLSQFDTVVLFSGGIGLSFTLPLLRDLLSRSSDPSTACPTRRVVLVAAAKSPAALGPLQTYIHAARHEAAHCPLLQVSISLHCTAAPTSSSSSPLEKSPLVSTSAVIEEWIYARPTTRAIIRAALETAAGESAVLVCGPPGLNGAVRRDVVALCDERAVHKGTGAQGVYFYSEGFDY